MNSNLLVKFFVVLVLLAILAGLLFLAFSIDQKNYEESYKQGVEDVLEHVSCETKTLDRYRELAVIAYNYEEVRNYCENWCVDNNRDKDFENPVQENSHIEECKDDCENEIRKELEEADGFSKKRTFAVEKGFAYIKENVFNNVTCVDDKYVFEHDNGSLRLDNGLEIVFDKNLDLVVNKYD